MRATMWGSYAPRGSRMYGTRNFLARAPVRTLCRAQPECNTTRSASRSTSSSPSGTSDRPNPACLNRDPVNSAVPARLGARLVGDGHCSAGADHARRPLLDSTGHPAVAHGGARVVSDDTHRFVPNVLLPEVARSRSTVSPLVTEQRAVESDAGRQWNCLHRARGGTRQRSAAAGAERCHGRPLVASPRDDDSALDVFERPRREAGAGRWEPAVDLLRQPGPDDRARDAGDRERPRDRERGEAGILRLVRDGDESFDERQVLREARLVEVRSPAAPIIVR